MQPLFPEPQAKEEKPAFEDLPVLMLQKIEDLFSDKIARGETLYGGFSTSASFALTLASGRRIFAKGNHPAEKAHGTENLRQEILVYQTVPLLQRLSPPFRGMVSDGNEDGWMLGFWDYVDHRRPSTPEEMVRSLVTLQEEKAESLRGAADQNYISLFLDGKRKWLRLQDEEKPRKRFLSLFEDAVAGEAWLHKSLPRLCACQQEPLGSAAALLHGDLRGDNFITGETSGTFVVDWPNACRGPFSFDPLMLFADLEARGIIAMQAAFTLWKKCGGKPLDPHESSLMAARIAGFLADQAAREVPEKLPRLRWMQKGVLLALLRQLHILGIIDSPPQMSGQTS